MPKAKAYDYDEYEPDEIVIFTDRIEYEEEEEDDDELELPDDDNDDEPEDDSEDEDLEHGEDEGIGDGEEQDDEDEQPAPRSSRRSERVRQLNAEKKELKARLEALERARHTPTQQPQNNNVDPVAEAAWLASLTPEERVRHDVGQVLRKQQQDLELTRFHMQDNMDLQNYKAQALVNPIYAKYHREVEDMLHTLRTQNRMNVPREEILKNIIGQKVLAGKGKMVSKKTATNNMKKNSTKTNSNKSDRQPNGARDSDKERRNKRLAGYTF